MYNKQYNLDTNSYHLWHPDYVTLISKERSVPPKSESYNILSMLPWILAVLSCLTDKNNYFEAHKCQ